MLAYGQAYWENLVQNPLWYKQFAHYNRVRLLGVGALIRVAGRHTLNAAAQQSREHMYEIFESLLAQGRVVLGATGENLYEWDCERKPIDTIVVHHTSRSATLTLPRLNAMELIRLYVPVYIQPSADDAPRVNAKPIYSGHFDTAGTQNFYPYHWFIHQDGTSKRLLGDDQIAWHCGDWNLNKRSIAICFDADLSHASPTEAMLNEARRILRTYYSHIHLNRSSLKGHNETTVTACPGDQFNAGAHWKKRLLS